MLLGVAGGQAQDAEKQYEAAHSLAHKDSHVVVCDMARSLWSFTEGAAVIGARAPRLICIAAACQPAAMACHAL